MAFLEVLNPFHADIGLAMFLIMAFVGVAAVLSAFAARRRYERILQEATSRIATLRADDPARPASSASSALSQDQPSPSMSRDAGWWEEYLQGYDDRFAEAAPGALVSLGLLGTFIGIAVAINLAGGTLQTAPDGSMDADQISQLSEMLEGIGLKFKSSAWGIIGALALRIVVFPVATRPRKRCAAELAALEQKRETEERVEKQKQDELRLAESFRDVREKLAALSAFAQKEGSQEGSIAHLKVLPLLDAKIEESRQDVRAIRAEAASQASSVHQLNRLPEVLRVLGTLEKVAQAVLQQAQEHTKASNWLAHLHAQMEKSHLEIAAIRTQGDQQAAAMRDMSEASKTFGRAAREMKESVSDLRKAYASESEKSRTMFEEQIKSLGSGLNAAIKEFAKQADGMASSVGRLATTSTAASQGIVDATKSLGTGLVSMEKNLESSLANMKAAVVELNKIMVGLSATATEANKINVRLEQVFKDEKEFSQLIAGNVLGSGKNTVHSIKELHKLIEERVVTAQHATITASALEDALKALETRLTEIRQSSSAAGEVGKKTLGVAEQLARSMASIDAALQAASSASARPAEGP
jgi:hypothetical protein